MVDPQKVISPKSRLSGPIEVVYCSPKTELQENFSIAKFEWEHRPAVGIRWNGNPNYDEDVGNPQSRGLPTWFILPSEIAALVLDFYGASATQPDGLDAAGNEPKSAFEERMEEVAERVLERLLQKRDAP